MDGTQYAVIYAVEKAEPELLIPPPQGAITSIHELLCASAREVQGSEVMQVDGTVYAVSSVHGDITKYHAEVSPKGGIGWFTQVTTYNIGRDEEAIIKEPLFPSDWIVASMTLMIKSSKPLGYLFKNYWHAHAYSLKVKKGRTKQDEDVET